MCVSPLTGARNVTLLATIPSSRLIEGWRRKWNIDITAELKGHEAVRLYRCNDTQLKFFLPVEVAAGAGLYERLQQFDWYYGRERWEHRMALKDVPAGSRLLEVGAGSGEFVRKARQAGIDATGIEISAAAVSAAGEDGRPVVLLDLEQAVRRYAGTMDTVCSFHVLEHVPRPREFIRGSLALLREDGQLIWCVPNADSFLKYQENLLNMPPHHLLHWTREAFSSLEALFEVRLEQVRFEPLAAPHVDSCLHAYARHFRSRFGKAGVLVNPWTRGAAAGLLRLGLRRLVRGQGMYVRFRKTGTPA
jgi:2-polyprenyl-3-methyl-5-hydroxy-6-metoxy-1,4-benzoquinol methylase